MVGNDILWNTWDIFKWFDWFWCLIWGVKLDLLVLGVTMFLYFSLEFYFRCCIRVPAHFISNYSHFNIAVCLLAFFFCFFIIFVCIFVYIFPISGEHILIQWYPSLYAVFSFFCYLQKGSFYSQANTVLKAFGHSSPVMASSVSGARHGFSTQSVSSTEPVVSVDWLNMNLRKPELKVLTSSHLEWIFWR